MPSLTLPYVPHYVAAPPSKEPLEYADLAIIDISKADTEEGRAALAIEAREALLDHGFFYVVNHGYSQDQTDRIFDIADLPFSADINCDITGLIARSLELPEDTLVNIHDYDAVGETFVRFMKYYPRTEEEETKTKNVWLKGHTDFGSITILWSQPVAGLQIMTPGGKWRWVRHIENALVVNAGDSLDFLTGGYYKGTIHRVVKPPGDQENHPRLGVFYFAMPNDDIKLVPMAESPVLQRVGIQRRCIDSEAPTMEQWRKARISISEFISPRYCSRVNYRRI
ncbi:hypothetical protein C8R48DRAFT_772055 [Suillus tomentosus]|nr:hypothetical protein C8R48DRAFT_772055 [Suillus tomentosus]